MEQFLEQFPIVVQSLNVGFLQTLKLFTVTLLGAVPLGLVIAFGSMSRFRPLSYFTKIVVWIIRGTPLMIQLLIIYYVVFGSVKIDKVLVAVLAFGLNSGAYVAEIVRSGIMSIDSGQLEAGRSLGFNYVQTMRYIIMPQAFKNVLPALGNEFIVLLKETSVAGYIALQDLTKGGDIIRSRTYSYMPLLAIALIYLAMVLIFTKLLAILERRLRNSER